MTIRVVVFDFGNVLGHFSHQRAAEQVAAYGPAGLRAEAILQYLFKTDLEPRFEVGGLTAVEVLNVLRQEFSLVGSDEELGRACSDMFTANESACRLVPILKQRYQLMLLSNTNELHYQWIRAQFAGTLGHFDELIASHEVGMRKPDPGIYRLVEERAGCTAGEIVFIDDLSANISVGRQRGWQTIHYTSETNLASELGRLGVLLS